MYSLETNHPSPMDTHQSFSEFIRSMPIGTSFFAPDKKINSATVAVNFVTKSSKDDRKYMCRTVTNNGVKGVRVWRIA